MSLKHPQASSVVQCDVLVIGGGITGASTALALAMACPASEIVLVESRKPTQSASVPEPDYSAPGLRVSALNLQSERFLRSIGVWPHLDSRRLKPYTALQVSENAVSAGVSAPFTSGGTTFTVDDLNDPAFSHLGTILENDLLQLGIWQQMASLPNLKLLQAELLDLTQLKPEGVEAQLNDATTGIQTVKSRLLIGADGASSSVRSKAGIRQMAEGYTQKALVIGVELEERAGAMTWQLFRPQGPVAYLPLFDCEGAGAEHCAAYASLVWYDAAPRIQALTQLDPEALLEQVKQAFPAHLPRIRRIYGRAAFPLAKSHCTSYSRGSVVLVGDAAHTVNPLAGQGLNMGLQDAEVLAAALRDELVRPSLPGSGGLQRALAGYERQRKPQNLLMTATVDAFYYTFSNEIAPLKMLRRFGLTLADKAGPLKRRVLKHALGLDQAVEAKLSVSAPQQAVGEMCEPERA